MDREKVKQEGDEEIVKKCTKKQKFNAKDRYRDRD